MKKSKSTKKISPEPGLDEALDAALNAQPKDIKVHISLRLDSDLYMELQRRAKKGEGGGKYQTLLNQLLRQALFEAEASEDSKREVAGALWKLLNSPDYRRALDEFRSRDEHERFTLKRPAALKSKSAVRIGRK